MQFVWHTELRDFGFLMQMKGFGNIVLCNFLLRIGGLQVISNLEIALNHREINI